jgi:Secretion system C-terminal sorting domain/Fibronectin type III domain/Bacterial pre-peptidase C-terminal domain
MIHLNKLWQLNNAFFILLLLLLSPNLRAQPIEHENGEGIKQRILFELHKTKDPAIGVVPLNAHWQALMATKQASEFYQHTAARNTALSWVERGPFTDVVGPSNGNTRANNGITAGRMRAVLVDAGDPTGETVWVGGVDGGLWKTTNVSVSPCNWISINDYLSNLVVGDICQDPTNNDIMYFCTGEAYYNADAVQGVGVFKSTDHGVTWSLLSSTTNFTYATRIVCDHLGNVYLATRGYGLQRSSDGGVSWTDITPTGMSSSICDLDITSTSGPARLHVVAGLFTTQSYRYTDNPATASSASGWNAPVTSFPSYAMRAEIACSGNVLYALPVNGSYQVPTIFKSTDGGANWVATGGQPAAGWANQQGWYSIGLGIDPSDPNTCIVGGLDCYKTTNGGTSWTKISNWVGTSGQYVHADIHDVIWYNNGNKLLFATDGGLHYSADKGTTIRDRNIGLRIKQFYSVEIHPTQTNYMLGGTQDNGTHQINTAGLAPSVEVTGGDGGFVAIDEDQPQFQFTSYIYNQYRRSIDGGNTWTYHNFSNNGFFINPFDYDNVANRIYASSSAGTYLRWDNASSSTTTTSVSVAAFNGVRTSAIKVSPYTANRVFFGTEGGRIVRIDNAQTTSPSITNITGVGMPGAYVSCINVGLNDQNLIACYSNYGVQNVWVSNNGGSSWTEVDGNLPNMPVRWCMFEPGDDTRAIIATETGVWETMLFDGANTIWIPSLNFPTVRTDMLSYRAADGALLAATHGRGIFSTIIAGAAAPCDDPLGLTATTITHNSATLGWSAVANAISYAVEYRENGGINWTTATSATAGTSVQINGLNPSTIYEWRVNTTCAAGVSSNYSTAQFTTLAAPLCNAPAGLASSGITSTNATIFWSAVSGALSYSVDYKLTSTSSWTNAALATTATTVSLTGLVPSSTYDWRVRTNCSGSLSSVYAQAQFTMAAPVATCPGIYDVSTNNTNTGGATIPFNTDIYGLINVKGDVDFYKFIITTGGTATVTLTNLPTNYDLFVHNSSNSKIAESKKTGTQNETISRTYTAGTYYVKIAGAKGAFNAANCYKLRINLGTATTANEELLIPMNNERTVAKLYPNPATSTLNISTGHKLDDYSFLQVYDLQGKPMMSAPFQINPQMMDISSLKTGMYMIRVKTAEGQAVYKFIKE